MIHTHKKGGAAVIKAIKMINCTPFQQAELSDCKKVNYVFGSNGSGKTTISTLLDSSDDSRFSQSSIVWDEKTHETICVYNRKFRDRNFQQTIPGIFTMGSATIDDINELERLKGELSRRKEEWEKRSEAYRKQTQEVIPARESKFKEDAWNQILKANETDFQKAFEGLRGNKNRFLEELKKRVNNISGNKGTVCQRTDLLVRARALYVGNPARCDRFVLSINQWTDKIDNIRKDPIWNTVIAGNEDVDIAALIKELGNSPWVDRGRQYMSPNSNICPFCQQETITDDFRKKIELFFDTEYKKRIVKMQTLLSDYGNAANQITVAMETAVQSEDSLNISKLNLDVYSSKVILLKKMYSDHISEMESKIVEPGKRIAIPDVSSAVNAIQTLLETANVAIDAHNKLVTERDVEEKKLTDDVWTTVIHESHSLITTYQSDIRNMEKAAKGIKKACDIAKNTVEMLEQSVVEKGRNITSVQPTIDEINRLLKAYGFTNFSIQPADGQDNYYCIKRNDGASAANTLSEGEETFLTFLYFMQWTKGSTDPEHVSDKKIIVLDDPISSLDSTVLYIVGAIVKDLSRKIKDGEGDVNQLFVLTHNVFFHKEASFDPRQSMGNNINFWVIRKDNDVSVIRNYKHNNPILTSYELLWAEIRDNPNISQISIQNVMRRIIENYFGMLGKGKDDSLLAQFETSEEQMIAKSLLYWINDGSHSIPDDLHIDSYTDSVPKYKKVFRDIFRASGHLAHYNMMMRIDDETSSILKHKGILNQ